MQDKFSKYFVGDELGNRGAVAESSPGRHPPWENTTNNQQRSPSGAAEFRSHFGQASPEDSCAEIRPFHAPLELETIHGCHKPDAETVAGDTPSSPRTIVR